MLKKIDCTGAIAEEKKRVGKIIGMTEIARATLSSLPSCEPGGVSSRSSRALEETSKDATSRSSRALEETSKDATSRSSRALEETSKDATSQTDEYHEIKDTFVALDRRSIEKSVRDLDSIAEAVREGEDCALLLAKLRARLESILIIGNC